MAIKQYVTVKEMPKVFPFLTIGGLRHLINKKKENGLEGCMLRLGNKILFDVEKFQTWMEKQGEVKNELHS